MNKIRKGSVGASLTWVVATISILVVIVVFVALTQLLFAEQSIGKIAYSSSENVKGFGPDSTQTCFAFLESSVDGKKVREVILEKDLDNLKKSSENLFQILPSNKRVLGRYSVLEYSSEDKVASGIYVFPAKSSFATINPEFQSSEYFPDVWLSENFLVKFSQEGS